VRVEHGSLAQTLAACRDEIGFHAGDVMAVLAPYSFDIFLFELLSPLLVGGTAVLVPARPVLDVGQVVSLLPGLTRLHAVPSLMRQIVAAARRRPSSSAVTRCRRTSSPR
jgi:non-ribosomal peptide synthetase component F